MKNWLEKATTWLPRPVAVQRGQDDAAARDLQATPRRSDAVAQPDDFFVGNSTRQLGHNDRRATKLTGLAKAAQLTKAFYAGKSTRQRNHDDRLDAMEMGVLSRRET